MKVVLIGSGNVATIMGKLMLRAGHTITTVISRNINAATVLAGHLNTRASNILQPVTLHDDIYIIAVSDAALAEVALSIQVKEKLLVHTTGSASKDVLQNSSTNYGVLYPLQSLRKEMQQLPIVPLLVDGSSAEVTGRLIDFAKTLSPIVNTADDEQRLKLHVAAVISSNFTNHLYTLTQQFCEKEGIAFSALLPLITETAQRLNQYTPAAMQTGPAARGDLITIEKHVRLLENYPEIKKIYAELSDSILSTANPVK